MDFYESFNRALPDLAALGVVVVIQAAVALAILRKSKRSARPLFAAGAVSLAVLLFGFVLRFRRVTVHIPAWWADWGRGIAILWAFLSVLMAAAYAVSSLLPRLKPRHSPARRNFLRAARWAVLGAPPAVMAYGAFVQRFHLRLREENIAIPGLPPDLNGLRLVQLTDIHLSPFLSVRELEHAVDMANQTRAHLALVTGDLITTHSDPLDDCLNALARLRAEAGVFGCMGNHEIYAGTERYTQEQGARLGLRFLRQQSALLKFGGVALNLAGVDYQRFNRPYLRGAEKLAAPDAFNVLLSHNSDVFPVAVRKGFPLTIAGHTHGGQVRVEILRQDLNIARIFTPYVDGLYREGGAAIFVSRGIGTIGLPARLGAPPEVALLTLWRT